jgi:hypothetical protein
MSCELYRSPIGSGPPPRNSIGGQAWLRKGMKSPWCRACERPMQLFFQAAADSACDSPFQAGSHLVVFSCPQWNGIPWLGPKETDRLPRKFWEQSCDHCFLALFRPGDLVASEEGVSLIEAQELLPKPLERRALSFEGITVGGEPRWIQRPRERRCCCGGSMALVAQVGENCAFRRKADAPMQPDSFSMEDYCLFLGNEVYLFACERQCDERAVWPVVQH